MAFNKNRFSTIINLKNIPLQVEGQYYPSEKTTYDSPCCDEVCEIYSIKLLGSSVELLPLFEDATTEVRVLTGWNAQTVDYISHIESLVLDKIGQDLQEDEDDAMIEQWLYEQSTIEELL